MAFPGLLVWPPILQMEAPRPRGKNDHSASQWRRRDPNAGSPLSLFPWPCRNAALGSRVFQVPVLRRNRSHPARARSTGGGWGRRAIPLPGTRMRVRKTSCRKALFYEAGLLVLSPPCPRGCSVTGSYLVPRGSPGAPAGFNAPTSVSRCSLGPRWRRSPLPLGLGRQGSRESQTWGAESVQRVELNNFQLTLHESFLLASLRLILPRSRPRPRSLRGIVRGLLRRRRGLSRPSFQTPHAQKIVVGLLTQEVK